MGRRSRGKSSAPAPVPVPPAPAVPKATPAPAPPPPPMPTTSGQGSFGVNSIEQPFGGLRGGPSIRRGGGDFNVELPNTTIGLTPGSEDKQEEDTITAPTINDEEKRREAAEKAAAWSS